MTHDHSTPATKHDSSRGAALLMLLILALAAAVRLAQLNSQSLTMDEEKDLAMARGGVANLQTSEDRFPPLYHALLEGWLQIAPWDATGRGFSVLCGVLTVAAVGGLGRVLGGPAAGLWAAGLMAVAPFAVWYSVEARAYGLYLLWAAVALWQFSATLQDNQTRHWIGFAAASIAGAYTHYYFGLLIALAGLIFLAGRPRRDQFVRGIPTFAVIAVATAPSLWLLKNDLDHPWGYARNSAFSLPALGFTYFSYLSGYTLGPSLRELHTLTHREAAVAAAAWLVVLGVASAVLFAQALAYSPANERTRRAAWLVVLCLAPPALIGAVSHFANFGYNVRHAVWACLPLVTLLAVGIAHGRPRWLSAAAAALLAIAFGAAQWNRLYADPHRNEDVRSAAQFVAAEATQAPVFVLSGYMDKPLATYLPSKWPVFALPNAEDENAAEMAAEDVRNHVAPGESFWIAYTREFHGDPDGALFAALDGAFDLKLAAEFAGVRLYRGTSR